MEQNPRAIAPRAGLERCSHRVHEILLAPLLLRAQPDANLLERARRKRERHGGIERDLGGVRREQTHEPLRHSAVSA